MEVSLKFKYSETMNFAKPDYIVVDYYPTIDEVGVFTIYGDDDCLRQFVTEHTRQVIKVK